MTDYQKGVRAAVLIIAALCLLCGLASLSGCLKSKAGFIGAALGSVYSVELLAGDEERVRIKERKQPSLFPPGGE